MARKSGYRGVTWSRRNGKWRAGYKLKDKHISLGMFDDVNDAGCAAGDFRSEMSVALRTIQRRANEGRSQKIREHKEKLPPEVLRAIALKGHAKRKPLMATNKSGRVGITWNSRYERWFIQVRIDGVRRRLGSYEDLDEAIRVLDEFELDKPLSV